MDKIGLVTISYNSENVLSAFLDCVWDQTHTNFSLYVIDNLSSDNTLSILKNVSDSRLVVIQNDINLGVAKANNQGIIRAIKEGCDQVLIINNDVEFEPTLIEKLLKVQKENHCSLVAPKIMHYADPNYIWYAGSWFNKKKGYLPLHRGLAQLDHGQFDQMIEVEYAPTCCLLVKKQVFDDIGLMDEKYFVYFDDTDFCYRILRDGRHKMLYFPFVAFFHKVGSLTKSFNEAGKRRYRGDFFIRQNTANHVYFLRKVSGIFAYGFIFWLFFKNNIRFIISPRIRTNFSTWWLINKSYFNGFLK